MKKELKIIFSKTLKVRVSENLLSELKKQATDNEMSLSVFVRKLLKENVKGG